MSNKKMSLKDSTIESHSTNISNVDTLQNIDNTGERGDTEPINLLSCKKLQELTKCENLEQVTSLEMRIDSKKLLLGNFGAMIPNLRYLKMTNSIIYSIRDVGSSFENLEVLWMSRCCLKSINGLENMKALRELYVSFNEISDISACGMLSSIQILDLEGNYVLDKKNISFLAMCPELVNLNLENNPITKQFKSYLKYWTFVKNQLPNLQCLDNMVTESLVTPKVAPTEYNFQDDWKYINELMEEFTTSTCVHASKQFSNENATELASHTPLKMLPMELPLKRVSSLHPSLEIKRLNFVIPEQEIMLDSEVEAFDETRWATHLPAIDTGNSNLTMGGVICGDIGKALRQRRNSISTPRSSYVVAPKPIDEKDEAAVLREDSAEGSSASGEQFTSDQMERSVAGVGRETDSGMASSRISSRCEAVSESELECNSIEALQMDCAEVLKELEDWRREFNKCSKKNLVRGINPLPSPEKRSLRDPTTGVGGFKSSKSALDRARVGAPPIQQACRRLLYSGNQSPLAASAPASAVLSRSCLRPQIDPVAPCGLRVKIATSAASESAAAYENTANTFKAKLRVQRSNAVAAKMMSTISESSYTNSAGLQKSYPNLAGRRTPIAVTEPPPVGVLQRKCHSRSRLVPSNAREVSSPADTSSSLIERVRIRDQPTLPSKPSIRQGNF